MSIRCRLNKLLEQQDMTYRENHMNSVRFCSLLPMRAIPAKVICLLGMEDGVFPKKNPPNPHNLLAGEKCDYCPTSTDYDRYLFLEAILSARSYLLMSYPQETPEKLSSILLNEFLTYLDSAYRILQQKPSEVCICSHPFYSFDSVYFQNKGTPVNYSKKDFQLSEWLNAPIKTLKEIIENIPLTKKTDSITLNIKDLKQYAKYPIKHFLKRHVGIFLEDEDRLAKADETFELDGITMHNIKNESIKSSIEPKLKQYIKEGLLPIGPFQTLALQEVNNKTQEMGDALNSLGIREEDIFNIEFKISCIHPEKIGDTWIVPPIKLSTRDGTNVTIVGQLTDVCSQGLIAFGKDNKTIFYKLWPVCLLLNYLPSEICEKNILLIEENEILNVETAQCDLWMEKYLHHYVNGMSRIPLSDPEWIDITRDNEYEAFVKGVKSDQSPDNHFKWVVHYGLHDSKPLFEHWKQLNAETFELIHTWRSKK